MLDQMLSEDTLRSQWAQGVDLLPAESRRRRLYLGQRLCDARSPLWNHDARYLVQGRVP